MTVKERLHQIVDEMSDREATTTLERLAVRRADPLARLLDAAAEDDEPLTDEEAAAIRDGYDELVEDRHVEIARVLPRGRAYDR